MLVDKHEYVPPLEFQRAVRRTPRGWMGFEWHATLMYESSYYRRVTFFADLESCSYGFEGAAWCPIAVGWLAKEQPYTKGAVDPEFRKVLGVLLQTRWEPWIAVGVHACELCLPKKVYGSVNIYVPGGDRVYFAPKMIVHYIDEHEYVPPIEFQRAVLACPPIRSDAYHAALKAAGADFTLPPSSE